MSNAISKDQAIEFLKSDSWRSGFSESSLLQGSQLLRSRAVSPPRSTVLATGDMEIESFVELRDSRRYQVIIALWITNGAVQIDASCDCPLQVNCEHGAATLLYLAKGDRLASSLGEITETAQPVLTQSSLPELKLQSDPSTSNTPRFILRVQRSQSGAQHSVVAHAYAIYQGIQVELEPSGNLIPIVTATAKIRRQREAEMVALQSLYALDLLPHDSVEKKAKVRTPQPAWLQDPATQVSHKRTWLPNKQAWPQSSIYWQRFRFEAVAALENRGWEVNFSHDVGQQPLVFRSESWKAEMVAEAKGWFHLSAGFEIDGESFELQPILTALLDNQFLEATTGLPSGQEFLIFLPDGRGLVLPVGRFRHILKTLGEILEFKFTEGPVKLSKLEAAQLVESDDFSADSPEELEQLAKQIADLSKIPTVNVPSGLQATLRPYQLEGFYWMQFLSRQGLSGILADDMGLGKTLQTLTHLLEEHSNEQSLDLPSLVLAPTSVVQNWQREAAKFTPSLKVLVLQGPRRKRLYAQIPQHQLVVTSYALIHRDLEEHLKHSYHLLILDEAQHIKNPAAQVTQSVCALNARHRLCLSGTPIENNLGELWSQFSFLMPGLLGSRSQFTDTYQSPIEKQQDEGRRQQLNQKVGPLILRRTKHDVAKELPPKTEILHTIPLNSEQKDLYETIRSAMDKHVRKAIIARGGQAQIVFLDALLKLRQVCCHPRLLESSEGTQQAESAKMLYLIDLLTTLRQENHRVLIFSQFTSMLSIIEDYLLAQKVDYLLLTGASKDRQGLVERFQGGEGEVFLISLKAGGTGLTLTGADTVIHYDPWWNPAAENQATDRAYRIGQNKAVMVHKLICQDTVEERIQLMQAKKNTLADNILEGATQHINLDEKTLSALLSD